VRAPTALNVRQSKTKDSDVLENYGTTVIGMTISAQSPVKYDSWTRHE
jgi:hypothetical protein